MTGLNPLGMMGITKMGAFDFPTGINAPTCKPNVDPRGVHPHIGEWYGAGGPPPTGFGSPKRQQGWPVIMEVTPEVEDPNVAPWIDLIIDIDTPSVIFHTGRLSGSMAVEVADNTHYSKVIAHAIPYKAGAAIPLLNLTTPLTPVPAAPNIWFWFANNANVHELIQTVKIPIQNPGQTFVQGEVYKLLIEWEFYHTVNGADHHEPFCGFDDSITFKVNKPTVV